MKKIHPHIGRVAIRRGILARAYAEGAPRSWTRYEQRKQTRVTAVLLRALRRGATLIECETIAQPQRWTAPSGVFEKQHDRAEVIARHVACRVCGFGWSISIEEALS